MSGFINEMTCWYKSPASYEKDWLRRLKQLLELLADNWFGAAAQIPVLPVGAGGRGHCNITVYSTVYINRINYLTNTVAITLLVRQAGHMVGNRVG